MVAIGYTSKGERKEFKINRNGYLDCSYRDLVSLKIPIGVKTVNCSFNSITKLTIPEGVKTVSCVENLLSKLDIPDGVTLLICDRNVLGLDKIDWYCHIKLY